MQASPITTNQKATFESEEGNSKMIVASNEQLRSKS